MSAQGAALGDGDQVRKLPPGRHGIPHDVVIANQRARLLDATTAIFAERGYAALTVSSVTDRASISRSTFYELVDGKLECVLAAQQRSYQRLQTAIAPSCSATDPWPTRVAHAIDAITAFAAHSPQDFHLLLASSHSSSEPDLARGISLPDRLAALLATGAALHPGTLGPDNLTVQATVGAGLSIVATCFASPAQPALADHRQKVRDGLIRIILAPYLGEAEAKRVASETRRATTESKGRE